MSIKSSKLVFAGLLVLWALICGWQALEHHRVRNTAQEALVRRARDISNSIGVVIRSQSRFGMIRYSRLQAALEELVKSSELQSVQLLNANGKVVASAGTLPRLKVDELIRNPIHWESKSAIFANLVDLGMADEDSQTTHPAAIVLPPEDHNSTSTIPPPPPSGHMFLPPPVAERPSPGNFVQDTHGPRRPGEGFFGPGPPRNFGRPPWMTEEKYKALLQERGLHGFILQISSASVSAETARDLRLRMSLVIIALLGVFGIGVGWNNIRRTAALQMRLVRASEMNRHLKEMNVAAAGLAHETRNPLNIVRGLAQIINRSDESSEEIRNRSREIAEEVDRVTGRLNEFIHYSRPPEPRPAPTNLRGIAGDVERTLGSDMADKQISFEITGPDLVVEADESLLRQVLFNLLINAIQAAPQKGRVEILMENRGHNEGAFEVRDNGAGVDPAQVKELFHPYFTTRQGGSGLGLAVVRQIVLAHQWEVEYIRDQSGITRFRVSGIRIV